MLAHQSVIIPQGRDGHDRSPLQRRKLLEDDPACTFAYPSCLLLEHYPLVTCFVTPAAAGSRLPAGSRSLKVLRLPCSWLRR